MKKILDLLNQLDKQNNILSSIRLFGDFSGRILYDNEEVAYFINEKECIKELEKLLK